MSASEERPAANAGAPPVYDGKSNFEYAVPGTSVWVKEAWARLRRLREDYETFEQWARDQGPDNAFAEQVAMDARARLAEWDQPVRTWEP